MSFFLIAALVCSPLLMMAAQAIAFAIAFPICLAFQALRGFGRMLARSVGARRVGRVRLRLA